MDVKASWKECLNLTTPKVIFTNNECDILGTAVFAWNYDDENEVQLTIEGSNDGVTWTALTLLSDANAYGDPTKIALPPKCGASALFYGGTYRYVRASINVAVGNGVSLDFAQFNRTGLRTGV